MPYVESSDGLSLWYVERGSRRPEGVLLMHGDGMSSKFWRRNIPSLAKSFRVIAPDMRGRGNSAKVEEGHSLDRYASDVQEILIALDCQRVIAVGWSIASFVLLAYMRRYGSDRLAGLVVVDQPPFTFVSEHDFEHQVKRIYSRRMSTARDQLRRSLGPNARVSEPTITWMAAEALKISPSCQVPALRDAYHSDFRGELASVSVPTLVCYARHGLIDADGIKTWLTIPHSRAVYFERSGHMLPWTEADLFNKEVTSFASSHLY